jgi:hypothetical protein
LLENENAGGQGKFALVSIRLPVALTFAALIGGLLAGIAGAASGAPQWIGDIAGVVGGLWLRALQMTIIPLVAALLVLGLEPLWPAVRRSARMRGSLALAGAAATGLLTAAFLNTVAPEAFRSPGTLLIALGALLMLTVFRLPAPLVVLIAAGAGLTVG